MKLTHENIHAAETPNGSFNYKQLHLLGVATPPRKGWLTALIGTEIPDERYAELMELRTAMHKKPIRSHDTAEMSFPDVAPDIDLGCKLPQPQEKRQQSPPVCVQMAVPIQLVETVQGLIRLLESLRPRS